MTEVNTYHIDLNLGSTSHTVIAATAGKAKYQAYKYFEDVWPDLTFDHFLRIIKSCKNAGSFKPSDLFGDQEKFDRIKLYRNIDFAYRGMKIEVAGKMGVIVGGNDSMNLDVVLDGECWASNCHPWWETRYFDREGNVIADYRKKGAS